MCLNRDRDWERDFLVYFSFVELKKKLIEEPKCQINILFLPPETLLPLPAALC